MIQRGLKHPSANTFESLENFVAGYLFDQNKKYSFARLEILRRKALHEFVVDTNIGQRSCQRSRCGTRCHTQKRVQEEYPYEETPETPARRTGSRRHGVRRAA